MESSDGKEDADPSNAVREPDMEERTPAADRLPATTALPLDSQTRSRNLTEKGQLYQCEQITKQLSTSYRKIKRQCGLVVELLQSTDADMVKAEMANLDKRLAEAEELNVQLLGLLPEDSQAEQHQKHELIDNEVFDVKQQACVWLKNHESEKSSRASSRSSRASSRSGHRSKSKIAADDKSQASSKHSNNSGSSKSSSKSQTQRKLANLKAEEEVLHQMQEAKNEELECRVRLETAKMESE